MGFITEEGLKQLDHYRYKPGGSTLFDQLMNYYWEGCVKLAPMWVAPNLITFLGWCLVIASYANMLRYDYTLTHDLPASAFFFSSFCIFTYSTLDAIDGKQARRTHSSSPLGQLFDHGCDSFSLTFFMLAICQAAKLEKNEIFTIFIVTQLAFWTSNWVEHHTGVLRTKVGQFGVTEGQFTLIIMHFLTGVYGQHMWKISALDLLPDSFAQFSDLHPIAKFYLTEHLGTVVVYSFAVSISFVTLYMIVRMMIVYKWNTESLKQFIGIVLLAITQLLWSTSSIYEKYTGVILVNFGILSSLLISKVIICSVTKMDFQVFHYELIPLILATTIILVLDRIDGAHEAVVYTFWACFFTNLFIIFHFLYTTINQITEYLGIECFTLRKFPRKSRQE